MRKRVEWLELTPNEPCVCYRTETGKHAGDGMGQGLDCSSRKNLNAKVLDFVQYGGPDLTVGSTVFELVLAF